MSVGLDLSGLNGLTTTENSVYSVQVRSLGNSQYSVIGATLVGTDSPTPTTLSVFWRI